MKNVNRIHKIMMTIHPDTLDLIDDIASESILYLPKCLHSYGTRNVQEAIDRGLLSVSVTGYRLGSIVSLTVDGMAVANHVLACRELEGAMK